MTTTRLTAAGLRRAVTAAGVAVLGGIVLSLVLGLLMWAGTSGGSPVDAFTGGVTGWVYVHGASLSVAGTTVSITPLGGSAVALGLIAVSVSRVRDPDDETWLAWGLLTIVLYTLTVLAVAVVVAAEALVMENLAFTSFVIATAGTMIGLRASWSPQISDRARTMVRAVRQAAAMLAVAGLAMVLIALFVQRDRFSDIWAGLDPGIIGGASLAVFCLAWIPNLAAWAVAVLLGPGFSLGVGTGVDLWGAQLGQVPAVPVLAAVPEAGSFPGWAFALATLPLLAGMLAGWRVSEGFGSAPMTEVVAEGAVAGALAGVLVAAVAAASGGALGPGLMAQSGPGLWPLIVLGPVLLGFGGALGAAAGHLRTSVADD